MLCMYMFFSVWMDLSVRARARGCVCMCVRVLSGGWCVVHNGVIYCLDVTN